MEQQLMTEEEFLEHGKAIIEMVSAYAAAKGIWPDDLMEILASVALSGVDALDDVRNGVVEGEVK